MVAASRARFQGLQPHECNQSLFSTVEDWAFPVRPSQPPPSKSQTHRRKLSAAPLDPRVECVESRIMYQMMASKRPPMGVDLMHAFPMRSSKFNREAKGDDYDEVFEAEQWGRDGTGSEPGRDKGVEDDEELEDDSGGGGDDIEGQVGELPPYASRKEKREQAELAEQWEARQQRLYEQDNFQDEAETAPEAKAEAETTAMMDVFHGFSLGGDLLSEEARSKARDRDFKSLHQQQAAEDEATNAYFAKALRDVPSDVTDLNALRGGMASMGEHEFGSTTEELHLFRPPTTVKLAENVPPELLFAADDTEDMAGSDSAEGVAVPLAAAAAAGGGGAAAQEPLGKSDELLPSTAAAPPSSVTLGIILTAAKAKAQATGRALSDGCVPSSSRPPWRWRATRPLRLMQGWSEAHTHFPGGGGKDGKGVARDREGVHAGRDGAVEGAPAQQRRRRKLEYGQKWFIPPSTWGKPGCVPSLADQALHEHNKEKAQMRVKLEGLPITWSFVEHIKENKLRMPAFLESPAALSGTRKPRVALGH